MNVAKSFQNGETVEDVLYDINFTIHQGELVIIKGTSGSGKSTLMKLIAGIDQIDSGDLQVLGRSFTNKKINNSLRAKNIGYIFQYNHLFSELTVIDNLLVVADIAGWDYKKMRPRAEQILAELGLAEKVNHYPERLSGGERQRAAIGRALMNDPPLILADEPTASLDSKRGMETFQLLKRIGKSQQKTIVMATHDERFLNEADRVFSLQDATLREQSC